MPKCSLKKCKNNTLTTIKKDGISYFRFPRHEIEREKWRKIVARERGEEFFKPNNSSVVCSKHFSESDMYLTETGLRKIKKRVLPRLENNSSTPLPSTVHYVVLSTSTVSFPANIPGTSTVEAKSLQPNLLKTVPGINVHPSVKTKNDTDPNLINRRSPSPTSSGSTSIFDSPKTSFYKRSLIICQKKIHLKNKQIQNLKKKNMRLMKRNVTLKEAVANLKKSNAKIMDILTAKKKRLGS